MRRHSLVWASCWPQARWDNSTLEDTCSSQESWKWMLGAGTGLWDVAEAQRVQTATFPTFPSVPQSFSAQFPLPYSMQHKKALPIIITYFQIKRIRRGFLNSIQMLNRQPCLEKLRFHSTMKETGSGLPAPVLSWRFEIFICMSEQELKLTSLQLSKYPNTQNPRPSCSCLLTHNTWLNINLPFFSPPSFCPPFHSTFLYQISSSRELAVFSLQGHFDSKHNFPLTLGAGMCLLEQSPDVLCANHLPRPWNTKHCSD